MNVRLTVTSTSHPTTWPKLPPRTVFTFNNNTVFGPCIRTDEGYMDLTDCVHMEICNSGMRDDPVTVVGELNVEVE